MKEFGIIFTPTFLSQACSGTVSRSLVFHLPTTLPSSRWQHQDTSETQLRCLAEHLFSVGKGAVLDGLSLHMLLSFVPSPLAVALNGWLHINNPVSSLICQPVMGSNHGRIRPSNVAHHEYRLMAWSQGSHRPQHGQRCPGVRKKWNTKHNKYPLSFRFLRLSIV